jgi:hypothetical protein
MSRPTVLLAALCLGITAACDNSGSALFVVNEWDQAVMLRPVVGSGRGSKLVPPMTSGTVFNTFGGAQKGWTVVVFDARCARLAEIPMKTNGMTVHIGSDGTLTTEPGQLPLPSGVQHATLADGTC